jgi:hypothetical protein
MKGWKTTLFNVALVALGCCVAVPLTGPVAAGLARSG